MKCGWLGLILAMQLATVPTSNGQGAAVKVCDTPEFRQFDFWVGEWDVDDAAGKRAGRNVISREQNGCVLVERWTSARGGTGMSMNHYDPRARAWKQHWVGLGLILEMTGKFENGVMTLEGPLQYVGQDKVTLLRGVWTALPDGRVRQHFTESSDEGKTWTDWFDGYYTRVKPAKS